MKQYIGTKRIQAVAMSLQEFSDKQGITLAPSQDGTEAGYFVEYTDDGYTSWSPKEVFEATYHPSETPLERMLIEGIELVERLKALKALLAGSKPPFISDKQWQLLKRQKEHMDAYQDVLNERIEDLANEKDL